MALSANTACRTDTTRANVAPRAREAVHTMAADPANQTPPERIALQTGVRTTNKWPRTLGPKPLEFWSR